MRRTGAIVLSLATVLSPLAATAQQAPASPQAPVEARTAGTLVILPAYSEVSQANDEVRATFIVEEQDRDKAAAASRVNLRMKQGTDILHREDPQAVLRTRGYFTYPVYAEEQPVPQNGRPPRKPQIVGWRVGQQIDMKTTNIARLPKVVAAAQSVVALNGLGYSLSEAATRRLDAQRIEGAWRHLQERIAAVAKSMGRSPADAVVETVDYETSGNYGGEAGAMAAPQRMVAKAMRAEPPVEEPSFEPGETTLQMRIVGKIRFR